MSAHRESRVDKIITRIETLLEKNRRLQQGAFAAALKSSEKAPWRRSKLMLIGEGMAGKTATVRSLLNESFDSQWKSTVGISMTEARTSNSAFWSKDSSKEYTMSLVNHLAVGNFQKSMRRENKVGRLVTNIESASLVQHEAHSKKRTQSDASKQSIESVEFNQYLFVRAKNNKASIRMVRICCFQRKGTLIHTPSRPYGIMAGKLSSTRYITSSSLATAYICLFLV